MSRNDKRLAFILLVIALIGFAGVFLIQNFAFEEGGTAVVYRDNQEVLQISLRDGSYTIQNEAFVFRPGADEVNPIYQRCFNEANIYCVEGRLGVVVIEFEDGSVRVIEETSPQNICQLQGQTNSPARQLTCLPNYVYIRVQVVDDDIDFYS